jgi:hypothetical protein
MLSVETSQAWSVAQMTITVPTYPAETYTHAGHGSAYHAAEDFTAWANNPARGWFGAALFTWSWTQGANRGAIVILKCSGPASVTWAPNGIWSSLLYHAGATAATLTASAGAEGTAAPYRPVSISGAQGPCYWSIRRAYRFNGSDGDAGPSGAVRPMVPGLAGIAPSVEAIGTPTDAARMRDALRLASNPRRLAVYDVPRLMWHELAWSTVSVEAQAPLIWRIAVEAAGEAL